jgi:acyl homoserine lactone synthase
MTLAGIISLCRSGATGGMPSLAEWNQAGTPEGVLCLNQGSLGPFGTLLAEQYRLRYRTFVLTRYWSGVRWFGGMEYDEYDTPAASYLVRPSPGGAAWGCLRVSPTDRPYMLKDNWPHLCTEIALPNSLSVWELTRLCVDQSLPKALRRQIRNELLCALLEFGLAHDVQKFIAVAHPRVWAATFADADMEVAFAGEEGLLEDGGGAVRAGMISVSPAVLKRVREMAGAPCGEMICRS